MTQKLEILHTFLIQQIFILQPGTFLHSFFSHSIDIHFATRYIPSFILFSSNRYSFCNQVHSFLHPFLIQQIFILQPGIFIHSSFSYPIDIPPSYLVHTFIHSSFSHPTDIHFATRYIHSFILFSSIRYSVCNHLHSFIHPFLIHQIFSLQPGTYIY